MGAGKNAELIRFLSEQYLCESLTLGEIEFLLSFTDLVEFRKNAIIADIGEVGEALYFVISGEAALVHDNNGSPVEIGRMKEGELMGEMSFFDREPRSVRLVSMSEGTKLLRLTRTMYQRLRVERPYIAVNLLEHAIISLDRLFRRLSRDVASFNQYIFGGGGKN